MGPIHNLSESLQQLYGVHAAHLHQAAITQNSFRFANSEIISKNNYMRFWSRYTHSRVKGQMT